MIGRKHAFSALTASIFVLVFSIRTLQGEEPAKYLNTDHIGENHYIRTNEYIRSKNGAFYAIMQSDGNFVVYRGSGPEQRGPALWSTGISTTKGDYYLAMQGDGNVVVYQGEPNHRGRVIWRSASVQDTPISFKLIIQDDGNLVAYYWLVHNVEGRDIWASGALDQHD